MRAGMRTSTNALVLAGIHAAVVPRLVAPDISQEPLATFICFVRCYDTVGKSSTTRLSIIDHPGGFHPPRTRLPGGFHPPR
eukprot:178306-Pyramimonas_sp.AAC.1